MDTDQTLNGHIETYAVVEIFGHTKIAGFCRTVPFGSNCMLRVDVPEQPAYEQKYQTHEYKDDGYILVEKTQKIDAIPAFTRYVGMASIFSLTPCTEQFAREAQKRMRISPPELATIPLQRMLPEPEQADLDEAGEQMGEIHEDEPF